MTMKRTLAGFCLALVTGAAGLLAAEPSSTTFTGKGVEIIPYGATLRVTIDGRPFTDYHYQNVSRPFFYPVIGPTGAGLTRNWPMGDGPGEAHDHRHHKSLWYAHGDINGVDFWSEGERAGHTVHEDFLEIRSEGDVGVIKTRNRLVSREGETVATDVRTVRIYGRDGDARMLDFTVTIQASEGPVVMGDTKEGTMAIRLTPTMRLEGEVGQGHIRNSEGLRDNNTWGKRAAWCDYYGPVEGETVGVAIFDHPSNPRHPTWWHVRNYGLFAANPFGIHNFESKPEGTGDFKIPAGDEATFHYRFYFHRGDTEAARVAREYERYAND